ncbi:MAG: metallophosphoesterase [Tannerella sp.]|jgi:3',5'-cyclic AMP phosphodiesterase CpdA|nr:metallophosphoesterase [Tannerella sp.]
MKKKSIITLLFIAVTSLVMAQGGKKAAKEELPRFAVISDTNFENYRGVGANVKVPKALKLLLHKQPKVDAVIVVGDLTNSAYEEEYDQFIEAFGDKANVPEGVAVYFAGGFSHDTPENNRYDLFQEKLKQPLNQYLEIKGYPFILLSEGGTRANEYNAEAKRYLAEKMADAAVKYPGKPIFVFVHVPPLNTCYGSWEQKGWGSENLLPVLEQYPQAVVFSGHSHFPLADPRSIYQDKFTVINDGGLSYSGIENGLLNIKRPENNQDIATGVIATVKPNGNVEIERWDTFLEEEILPKWTIKAPHNGKHFTYKNRNGLPAPVFAKGVLPEVRPMSADYAVVTFRQASDNEIVHHYVIEIRDENQVIATFRKFSQFYLNSQIPKWLSVGFAGLPPGKQLYATVTAVDSYNNSSVPLKSKPFVLEGRTAARPELKFRADGKFVIMQMTDLHWGPKDRKIMDVMTRAIQSVKPNLILLTGDIVLDGNQREGDDMYRGWSEVTDILTESDIPWAILFGNHDTETELTKPDILEMLSSLPGNLTENGPEDISGDGNYVLKIGSSQSPGKTEAALYCFDSRQQDDWIDFSQIDWYRTQSSAFTTQNKGKPLPSLAFFHIPIAEYNAVAEKAGTVGDYKEKVCDPPLNSGLFASFTECKDVMGTFCGHDHANNYIGYHHDICLAYGYATTVADSGYYMGIGRGVRVIELTEGKRTFGTHLVKLCDEPVVGALWKLREKEEIIHPVVYPDSFIEK